MTYCKHCGIPILLSEDKGRWFHTNTLLAICLNTNSWAEPATPTFKSNSYQNLYEKLR